MTLELFSTAKSIRHALTCRLHVLDHALLRQYCALPLAVVRRDSSSFNNAGDGL